MRAIATSATARASGGPKDAAFGVGDAIVVFGDTLMLYTTVACFTRTTVVLFSYT